METKIMRVVQQGDVLTVQSPKSEGGTLKKRNIILREMGGKYENTYAAAMLGTTAELSFGNHELVVASLRFQVREYNGQMYQDIVVADIDSVKK